MSREDSTVINEEVLIRLLEKAISMEEANINILLKLFVAEDDESGRKKLYELLRDSEYHKVRLMECLRTIKGGEEAEPVKFKQYEFEDMLYAEKAAILRKVVLVLRDFHTYLLEDVEHAVAEGTINGSVAERVTSCLETILKGKQRHMGIVREIWRSY
ncbi:hypothetical protein [Geoglobus acetivorans]|uniref:Rubrerythrin diiron-binding domain-containing protein n=1 Tax=Geoglobus acetivorans TaxID=565033 RepID=A0ABZ3H2G1_GEOAI|nr:hypothetical protein [Geoglobus acetivorans]